MSAAPSTLKRVRRLQLRGPRSQLGAALTEYELLIAVGAMLVVAAMLYFAGNIDTVIRGAGESTAEPSQPAFTPPVAGQCDASYQGVCIPPAPPDLNCADIVAMGIPVPITVVGNDPHALDENGDGLAC
jgi:Flp pilus assembly pilin Flp